MTGHRRGLEHLTFSLRRGAEANRRRVRLPKVRVRRLTLLHYRKRLHQTPWLVDPANRTLTPWGWTRKTAPARTP